MTTQTNTVENGVNVAALLGAREALGKTPEAARFKWRASREWIKGTHSRATVDSFFGFGGEQQHRQIYQFDSDHPEIFVSEDSRRSVRPCSTSSPIRSMSRSQQTRCDGSARGLAWQPAVGGRP